jgi:rhodanese-related sulfurtransferase
MRDLWDASVGEGRAVRVLDVRAPSEWTDDGMLPGSETIYVADLPARLAAGPGALTPRAGALAPDEPMAADEWWVVCATGIRASLAASVLDAAEIPVRLVARGGVIGWVERFEAALAR